MPSSARKGLELSRNHGQNFEVLVGLLNRRVDHHFSRERHTPGFAQERKRKSRHQPKAVLVIASSAIEVQPHFRRKAMTRWKIGKIGATFEDPRRGRR